MDVYIQQPECRQALDKMLDEALLLADELDDLQEVSIHSKRLIWILMWYSTCSRKTKASPFHRANDGNLMTAKTSTTTDN